MYKVFLTHSSKNMEMVISLHDMLKSANVEVYVAEFTPEPGEDLNNKIKQHLEHSDAVLLLLTDESIRSDWVWREIRYALQSKIMVVPLIEKRIEIPSLLKDIDCLFFDKEDYLPAYQVIHKRIASLNERKKQLMKSKSNQNIAETRTTDTALVVFGVLALFLIVAFAVGSSK